MPGFLTLRPRCEACGLDYAFIDTGDGPAIFIIMLAGAIVVGCALIVEVKYQPPFWLHAVLWLPLILVDHAVAAARDEGASDRAAIPPQGRAWPADRPRAEMTATAGRRRRGLGFGLFTLAMVAVFVGLGVWQLQRRVEKHALDGGPDRTARGRARIAAAACAVERARAGAGRISSRQFQGDLCMPVRMRWSIVPARPCARIFPVPAPGPSCRRGCRPAKPS